MRSMCGKKIFGKWQQSLCVMAFATLATLTTAPHKAQAAITPSPALDARTARELLDDSMLLDVLLFVIKRGKAPQGTALRTSKALIAGARVLAKHHGETPEYWLPIIMGIAKTESTYHYRATSPANARGLMQVHWPTWGRLLSRAGLTSEDLYNQDVNVPCGALIFAGYLKEKGGSVPQALNRYYGSSRDGYAGKVLRNSLEFVRFQKQVAAPFRETLKRKLAQAPLSDPAPQN